MIRDPSQQAPEPAPSQPTPPRRPSARPRSVVGAAKQQTRLELTMLLIASTACVGVLTSAVAVQNTNLIAYRGFPLELIALALVSGIIGAVMVIGFFRAYSKVRAQARGAQDEARALRDQIASVDSLIRAEPQVLIKWDPEDGLKLISHTISAVQGLPSSEAELLSFGGWLDAKSATNLQSGLDTLLTEGRSFNVILKTLAGGHVEADGRAASGHALLRLRDLTGYKRDVSMILDQHARLSRDVRSSRALLDVLPNPAWLRDESGRLSWVNASYVAAVEARTSQEVLDSQIELLESRQRNLIQRTISNGEMMSQRMPVVIGTERRPHDVSIIPLGDMSAGVAVDIAAAENAQDELDRQTAAYERTLDRVTTAVAVFNSDQKLTFYNAAYEQLWQLGADWLDAQPSAGAVLDRLREFGRLPEMINYREWKAKILRGFSEGMEGEDWWNLPDGRMVHVMGAQRPDGGVTYLYADETQRLALESRYNALINVQSETLNSLKEGVAVFGTDGRLSLSNSAFAAIWQLSAQQLAQRPHIEEFIRLVEVLYDDAATWLSIGRAVTAFSDEREPVNGQMVRPDQSVINYATTPLPDGGTLLTFVDVTHSQRYERALIERNEALEASDKLKNRFIGHVSYELRTPLTNIIGFSELLANPMFGELSKKQLEYLGDISVSSKTLLAIIDDILDLATIDAGGLELNAGVVSVANVVDAAIAVIREPASRAELTLDVTLTPDAREFVADERRVRQVLYNLLSNAISFSNPGGLVKLACWRKGGAMYFSVEDNGIGIPKEQQASIFGRFESRSQSGRQRGAGLGLALVKSLVDLHGGDTLLESEPGRGTRVTVRFPEAGPKPQVTDVTATQAGAAQEQQTEGHVAQQSRV